MFEKHFQIRVLAESRETALPQCTRWQTTILAEKPFALTNRGHKMRVCIKRCPVVAFKYHQITGEMHH